MSSGTVEKQEGFLRIDVDTRSYRRHVSNGPAR
jgi:hypothetical protein